MLDVVSCEWFQLEPSEPSASPPEPSSDFVPEHMIDVFETGSLISSYSARHASTEMLKRHTGNIYLHGFTLIEPKEFSQLPLFIKPIASTSSSLRSSLNVIRKDFISIAKHIHEQSVAGSNQTHPLNYLIRQFYSNIDDNDAPMINLAKLEQCCTAGKLKNTPLDNPPVPYDHLWRFIMHVFNTVTFPIGKEVFGCRKLKTPTDIQLIVSDRNTPQQHPHIDGVAPMLNTFVYFDDTDEQVDCTLFRRTVHVKEGLEWFGSLEELLLHQPRWDQRYELPWTDEKHPVISPPKVPNVTIAVASSNIIHHAPKPTTAGKRYVLFFSTTLTAITLHDDEANTNTNEVTYAFERYKEHPEQHKKIVDVCQKYGNWEKLIINFATKQAIQRIIKKVEGSALEKMLQGI